MGGLAVGSLRLEMPPELEAEVLRCFRCGYCRSACPTFAVMGSESWNARGRLILARSILEGLSEPTPDILDRIFSCTSCLACEAVCPAVVRIVDALVAFKEALLNAGVRPPARLAELSRRTAELGSPIARRPRDFEVGGKRGELLVFTGCVASEYKPELVMALEKVLNAMEVSYSVLEGPCCGAPLLKMGLKADAKRAAEALASKIRASGAELIITPCPACLDMLIHRFRHLTGMAVRAQHTTEFLAGLLRSGKLHIERPVELKAVYHDPCVLGRGLGIYDAPRELLWAAGLTLVEMRRSKASSFCCGHGFLAFELYPELADALAEERLKEALRAGADALITACPSCLYGLSKAVKRSARFLAVSDVVEVVAEVL